MDTSSAWTFLCFWQHSKNTDLSFVATSMEQTAECMTGTGKMKTIETSWKPIVECTQMHEESFTTHMYLHVPVCLLYRLLHPGNICDHSQDFSLARRRCNVGCLTYMFRLRSHALFSRVLRFPSFFNSCWSPRGPLRWTFCNFYNLIAKMKAKACQLHATYLLSLLCK